MNKEKDFDYYNEDIRESQTERAYLSATLRARAKIISKLIKKYGLSGNLLDAGCGTGNILYIIMKENPKRFDLIEAFDFSEEACKLTSNLGIKTYVEDLRSIKLKRKYSLIICSEVLEHINDDDKAIENLKNMLDRDGYLIITVPFLKKNWSSFDEISGHVRRYEPQEMENKLIRKGFKIIRSFAWGNFLYKYYFLRFIKDSNPHSKLSSKNIIVKKRLSNILANVFMIDNLFINKNKGITLFIIAKNSSKSWI